MTRLGIISFQASDRTDVFLVADVIEAGVSASSEMMLGIEDAQFDSDKAWVTGYVPEETPVDIDGDNPVIQAWFKGEEYINPFVMRIYLTVEEAKEFVSIETEEQTEENEITDEDIEQEGEINL